MYCLSYKYKAKPNHHRAEYYLSGNSVNAIGFIDTCLPFSAYSSFKQLVAEVEPILSQIGEQFKIQFVILKVKTNEISILT